MQDAENSYSHSPSQLLKISVMDALDKHGHILVKRLVSEGKVNKEATYCYGQPDHKCCTLTPF
jgi:hypothetical protein